jgi:hypothetical protein
MSALQRPGRWRRRLTNRVLHRLGLGRRIDWHQVLEVDRVMIIRRKNSLNGLGWGTRHRWVLPHEIWRYLKSYSDYISDVQYYKAYHTFHSSEYIIIHLLEDKTVGIHRGSQIGGRGRESQTHSLFINIASKRTIPFTGKGHNMITQHPRRKANFAVTTVIKAATSQHNTDIVHTNGHILVVCQMRRGSGQGR